jgi:hypothetical protein
MGHSSQEELEEGAAGRHVTCGKEVKLDEN